MKVTRIARYGLALIILLLLFPISSTFSLAHTLRNTDQNPATPGKFTMFPIPTPKSEPWIITAGPDGNLWFTEFNAYKVGRITPQGTITEFPVPNNGDPIGITAGPDGNVWFVGGFSNNTGFVDRITPSGQITQFTLPGNGYPSSITTAPDGNLWFTMGRNIIGKITTSGQITQYTIPGPLNYVPNYITVGADGNLWFTKSDGYGETTLQGSISSFVYQSTTLGNFAPLRITRGPDGNIWATTGVCQICAIGRITVGTAYPIYSTFKVPHAGSGDTFLDGITTGPDNNLWFLESDKKGSNIDQRNSQGQITEYPFPVGHSGFSIIGGPDGNLWFTDIEGNEIGMMTLQ